MGTSPKFAELCELGAKGARAWQDGRAADALDIFRQLVQADAASPLWAVSLARALRSTNDWAAEVVSVCDEALAHAPFHAELLLLRGCARFENGGPELSRPDFLAARAVGGLCLASAQELAQKLKAIGEQPDNPPLPASALKATFRPTPSARTAPLAGPAPPQTKPARASPQPAPTPATKAAAGGGQGGGTCAKGLTDAADALKTALKHEGQECYALASQHARVALKHNPNEFEAILCLARSTRASGGGAGMLKVLRKEFPAALKQRSTRTEALSLTAMANELTDEWDEAVIDLEQATKSAKPAGSGATAIADQAAKVSTLQPGAPCLEDLQGRLARAQLRAGERETAGGLAQKVLETQSTQREACEVACAILLDRGDSATALAVMLRCVIGHRNRPSRENADIVCGVMRRCSVEELLHVLAPKGQEALGDQQRSSVAEVVAYAGLVMKERSEALEACRLYKLAATLAPTHGSLCLNLAHAFVLRGDDLTALAWSLHYMDYITGVGSKAVQPIRSALRGKEEDGGAPAISPESMAASGVTFYDTMAIGFVMLKTLFLSWPYAALIPGDGQDAGGKKEEGKPPWRERLLAVDVQNAEVKVRPVGMRGGRPWTAEGAGTASEAAAASEAHRGVMLKLCAVLDRARKGHDLHRTPVRNEHAYFSCIHDVVTGCLPPAPEPGAPLEPVYVVGDSHTLSSAWRTVHLPPLEGRPERLVLVPCLVTGAKIWHLRESSTFYTKFAFWESVNALPPSATIIFNLGEIDCREGILKAVQQGKYADIEAALRAIVQMYLVLLRDVRRRLPRSRIFVHPVAYVLPETRFLTFSFNEVLGEPASRAALDKMGARLLEFAPVFEGGHPVLGEGATARAYEKLQLLPELRLDGTHMNPAYVTTHLQPALAAAWPAETSP